MMVKQYVILSLILSQRFCTQGCLSQGICSTNIQPVFIQNNTAQSTNVHGPLYATVNTYMNNSVMIFFDGWSMNIMLNWLRIPSTKYVILCVVAYCLSKSYKWGNFMHIIGSWCGSKKVDETVLISVAHFKGLYHWVGKLP